jgi:hypothetical protein
VVDYMSLEEQVDKDFERARRRAIMGRLAARLRGDRRRNGLLPFDEVRRAAGAENRTYRGGRLVEVSKIVGSVGRHAEFDANFMPTKASATRWKGVDRAFQRGVDLPPVSLYRIGDLYFVHDGNHRVSVARYHGVEWVDAEVTEFRPWPAVVLEASQAEPSRAGPLTLPPSSSSPSTAPVT